MHWKKYSYFCDRKLILHPIGYGTSEKIPYGIARFEQVRDENAYYVDKTSYLPLLEETGNYLFLIRPRRFGKSVFVSMLQAYYDIAKADRFDTLFDGLWIQQHSTPLKNVFQVIYFDFSLIGAGFGELEENFNTYCAMKLIKGDILFISLLTNMITSRMSF